MPLKLKYFQKLLHGSVPTFSLFWVNFGHMWFSVWVNVYISCHNTISILYVFNVLKSIGTPEGDVLSLNQSVPFVGGMVN